MTDKDGVPASETTDLPANVIDITSRRRALRGAHPAVKAPFRPYLQLVDLSPPELPAA